jgi:hypothetical protein
VQILCALLDGPVRLSQLRRLIPTASKKGLTANLRSLETLQLILRRDLSNSVLHVEYEIAEAHECLWRRSSVSLLGFRSIYLLLRMISDPARVCCALPSYHSYDETQLCPIPQKLASIVLLLRSSPIAFSYYW